MIKKQAKKKDELKENQFIVQKIVGKKTIKGIKYFKVKWKDWPAKFNQWVQQKYLRPINIQSQSQEKQKEQNLIEQLQKCQLIQKQKNEQKNNQFDENSFEEQKLRQQKQGQQNLLKIQQQFNEEQINFSNYPIQKTEEIAQLLYEECINKGKAQDDFVIQTMFEKKNQIDGQHGLYFRIDRNGKKQIKTRNQLIKNFPSKLASFYLSLCKKLIVKKNDN